MDANALVIAVPEPLRGFVESEAAAGGYRNVDEYIHTLIRDAQTRKVENERRFLELRKEVANGIEQLERGECQVYNEQSLDEFSKEIQTEVRRKLAEQNRNGQT